MKKKEFKIDGETFNVWYWEGPKDGRVFHWAHANGFNGATYENFLSRLSKYFHVYAWDGRLHGLSQNLAKPVDGRLYDGYSQDLIKIIDTINSNHEKPVVLAGHSFGASLCVKAEASLRDKIECIILADPVFFTPLQRTACRTLRFLGFKLPRNLYLSQNALKRKNFWRNSAALLDEYSKKSLFKNWDEYSLKNYVKYGTTKQGNGIKLACSPELESQIFRESENTFLSNHIISLKTPTYIFSAQYGSPPSSKSAIWRSKYVIAKTRISGANHFFPVERASTFSEMIIELLC